MAFADAIRSATATREQTADLLEDLLVDQYFFVNSTGSITTTSTTDATMTSMTGSVTVETGDLVEVHWWVTVSGDTVGDTVEISLYQNGVRASGSAQVNEWEDTDADGRMQTMAGTYLYTSPTTGTITHDLRWKRGGGTGTQTARYRAMSVKVFRQS